MYTHATCRKWSLWSYKIGLRKPLAVLGGNGLIREGWILGRFNNDKSKWNYGEISPLPSFHKTNIIDVYNDIINTVRYNKKPTTALVKTVIDIWQTPIQEGIVHINSLLDSNSNSGSIPQQTIKIKLGRQSLDKDIEWFTRLQCDHPGIQWRLDCNKQWTLDQLRNFWACCNPLTIEYIEDPLHDPSLLEQVPDIPIALDESLIEYQSLLDCPNVVAAIIKPTLHLNWQQILQRYSVKGVISSTFEGSLGIWGLGQLALSHTEKEKHGLGTLDWFAKEVVAPPLRRSSNQIHIPSIPPTPIFSQLKWEDGE